MLVVASIVECCGFKREQVRLVKWILLAFLICFIGMRYRTGSDWQVYLKAFEKMPIIGNYNSWEPGFYWLMRFIYDTIGSYYFVQFLGTLFLFYAINRFYSRYSVHPIFSITLFVCLFFLSILMAQVRQGIALAIVILGAPFIFKRKIIEFSLVICLASLFHISALMAFPLYFLDRRWGNKLSISLLILCQFLYFFPSLVLGWFDAIGSLLPGRLGVLVDEYTGTFYTKGVNFGTGLYYIAQMVIYGISIIINNNKEDDKYAHFYANALLITTIIIALSNSVVILKRFESYYYVFGILSLANLLDVKLSRIKLNSSRFICMCILLIFFLFSPMKGLLSKEKAITTKRPLYIDYVPYYNVLSYPIEADKRGD